MRELIAKKYVNALLKSTTNDELNSIIDSLNALIPAFGLEKFRNIIQSPNISASEKESLVLELLDSPSPKLTNFIKLLSQKDRLGLLPSIKTALDYQLRVMQNRFEGVVEGSFELSDEQLKALEESFGKKFDAKIELRNKKSNYPGIRVALDDLGVEVSFSLERLKAQMAEHILKAI
jgi:F-type H+-transporting ATPase subunit delta